MKIKTQELTGVALDWAVAKCEGAESIPNYSESWKLAGPIIEREKIEFRYDRTGRWANAWIASTLERMLGGPTPLIAAMRCYVVAKLGDVVDIPEELLK